LGIGPNPQSPIIIVFKFKKNIIHFSRNLKNKINIKIKKIIFCINKQMSDLISSIQNNNPENVEEKVNKNILYNNF